MKWGMHPNLRAREFWKSLQLPGEWIEGETPELVQAGVRGIFVNPDQSDEILAVTRRLPRVITQSHFLDYLENDAGKLTPVSHMLNFGTEIFALGQPGLNTHLRAYITGTGPWAYLFATLAIQKGFSDLQIVVPEAAQAQAMIEHLKSFCFGVKIEALRHADLTLQPNNGSLLVNTLSGGDHPDLIEDLAYLNYLSPHSLVIETHQNEATRSLLDEARNSNLAVLDGAYLQTFAEFQALRPLQLNWTFEEYREKRTPKSGNSPSVQ